MYQNKKYIFLAKLQVEYFTETTDVTTVNNGQYIIFTIKYNTRVTNPITNEILKRDLNDSLSGTEKRWQAAGFIIWAP